MRVMNSVFRIENDILLLNTYFNLQMYKKFTYHQILALVASSKTRYVLIENLARQASHSTELSHQNYKNNPTLMLSYTQKKTSTSYSFL